MIEPKKSNYYLPLIFLIFTHFMIEVYIKILPAALPTLRSEFKLSLLEASLIISIPLMVKVLTYIPTGYLSDKIGTKLISISLIISTCGSFIIVSSKNLIYLITGSILITLGSTLYHPPSLKAISILDESRISLTMGSHLAGGGLGVAIGPIVLGFIMPIFGWRSAFLIWIPFTLMTSLFYFIYSHYFSDSTNIKIKKNKIKYSRMRQLFTKKFVIIVIACALTECVFLNISSFITTYFTFNFNMSESMSSIIFGLGPLIGIIFYLIGGTIGDKYTLFNITFYSIGSIVCIFLFMPYINNVITLSTFYILYRIIVSIIMPQINSLIALNSTVDYRSMAFGVFWVIKFMGGSLATLITSLFANIYGISVMFPLSILILIISAILLFYSKHYT